MHAFSSGLRISFDNPEGDAVFISHAHSDHVGCLRGRKDKRIIASEETVLLGGLGGEMLHPERVTLHEAGHILGAKQIAIEDDGEKTVYTGDINLRESVVTKSAEMIECDRLIIDATYADPTYRFPAYTDVCDSIGKWVNDNLAKGFSTIIGGYELGKAQELIKIINMQCGAAPVVNEKTAGFSDIYNKFGAGLDFAEVGTDDAEAIMKDAFVAIVPMRHAKKYFAARLSEAFGRKTLSAVATGWALTYRFNVDNSFPLSDHADFYDLKEYVKWSGAKELEFIQGDGKHLLASKTQG